MSEIPKGEMPELPEARIESYQNDSTMRWTKLHTYDAEDMREYGRACVAAALLRNPGQAPVAWASPDWMRAITETELALIPNTGVYKGRRDRCRLIYPTPLYARATLQAELDVASDGGTT